MTKQIDALLNTTSSQTAYLYLRYSSVRSWFVNDCE
jgi:hypothetical protein